MDLSLHSGRGLAAFALLALVALTSASQPADQHDRQQSRQITSHGPAPEASLVSVQTSSGLLRGRLGRRRAHDNDADGAHSVLEFLGVPYALPPTGQRRFRRPSELPGEQAGLSLEATKFGKTCPQHRHLARFVSPLLSLDQESSSEDCLKLNVFVPTQNSTIWAASGRASLPVVVFIPGEGFDFADARQYDGSQLALRTQSIVVTVQYRVGVLGLLQAPEWGVEGNMALHDQLAALRWVNKNIEQFGGDPLRVSLMGRFTGSMSISALLTAPQQHLIRAPDSDRSLFSRAIMASGIAVNDWIISPNQSQRTGLLVEEAIKRGLCGRGHNGSNETCLWDLPIGQLMEISGYEWRLVRDDQLIGQAAPIEAVASNQIASDIEAIMLGETSAEGTLCLYRHMLMAHLNNYAQLINEDRLTSAQLYELLRADSAAYFKYNLTQSNPIQMALEAVMSAPADSGLRQKYLDACSSYMVKSHNQRFKRQLQARNQLLVSEDKPAPEVHHYELKYKPSFSLAPEYISEAAHGDDIPLIFGLVHNQPKSQVDPADLVMTNKMLAYVGNFVHGNHPLLQQHNTAELPEDQQHQAEPNESTSISATRRSWANEGQVHSLDVEVEPTARLLAQAASRAALLLKLVIVERPMAPRQNQEPLGGTRSQRLMELHQLSRRRQQQQEEEELKWIQRRGQQLGQLQQQQQPLYGSIGHTTSQDKEATLFLTVLLLTSSVVILALMMVCILTPILAIRYYVAMRRRENTGAAGGTGGCPCKRSHHPFSGSSSTCNICDESHGGSIDAVLNQQAVQANKKSEHPFCGVFTKLTRSQASQLATQQQHQQSSATTTASPTSQPLARQQ